MKCIMRTRRTGGNTSPPAWWCGLKFAAASAVGILAVSPPAWWCGLKFISGTPNCLKISSPPAWWCGLKSCLIALWILPGNVTTCVVVWIEIKQLSPKTVRNASPPAWWCGLKFNSGQDFQPPGSHHLRGGVD